MLRIALIVAIVAGLGALGVSQFQVAEKLTRLNEELTTTQTSLTQSQAAERSARKNEADAKAAAEKSRKELETAKTDLVAAVDKADQQERRANDFETRLNKSMQERNDAQADLARWKAFNRSIEELQAMINENRKLLGERESLSGENTILARKLREVQNELAVIKGDSQKVELPAGLKGRVVAVDPKYEFVVLDIGQEQGVLARGEMLVNRSGRMVAKVRILTVQPNRCVANVLPDWKQGEILEGDHVIVGL